MRRISHGLKARAAFTLIELLVVVAIIALLVAILLPTLQQVRYQARRVKCQVNLRNLAQAWSMYLDEYSGRFPRGLNLDYNYGGQQGAGSRFYGGDPRFPVPKPLNSTLKLDPIVGTLLGPGGPRQDALGTEVFLCPSDRGSESVRPTNFDYYGTSYRTNHMIIGKLPFKWPPDDPCDQVFERISNRLSELNQSDIQDTSRLALMGDAGWVDAWRTDTAEPIEWHHRTDTHNVAFMDGHVAFTLIRKGIHTCSDYTTIPYAELANEAYDCQQLSQWP